MCIIRGDTIKIKRRKKAKDILNKDIKIGENDSKVFVDHESKITLKDIKENPENYIKINIVKSNTIIETTYVLSKNNKFKYNKKDYDIDESKNLHEPKGNYVIPTAYYTEGDKNQLSFKNFNLGIPAKILTLLFDPRLYSILINLEDKKVNWILIIVILANIVLMGIVIYGLYNGGYLVL